MGQLLGLAGAVAGVSDRVLVLESALPPLLEIAGAEAALVVSATRPAEETALRRIVARAGLELSAEGLADIPTEPHRLTTVDVPGAWRGLGIGHAAAQALPGHAGIVVLAWTHDPTISPVLELALAHLESAVARAESQENLADLAARVDNAQLLANMGDYDWHIPTDTNTWSDQLFRIYGHEPQSFHPSYERFLSLIHPDDRDRISALHQQAYATGEPYAMIERIVRPNGEVRYLSSNGEVIMDDEGTPVRMRGTCLDITDRVHADEQRTRISAWFQSLVESAPDAILVLDQEQQIVECNQRAREMLNGDPHGHRIQEILPTWPRTERIGSDATGFDGRDLVLDVITTQVNARGRPRRPVRGGLPA